MIVSPGGSSSALPVAPAIKDLINGIRGNASSNQARSIEYIAEALRLLSNFDAAAADRLNSIGTGSSSTSGVNAVAQKATFLIGLGANQPASIGTSLAGWDAAFTQEKSGAAYNTAVWKYCLISALFPPTSTDFIMDLKLDGTSIFDSSFLTLPNGTAALDIVIATNFASGQAPITEKVSNIVAEVRQTGPEVIYVTAVLMFDLIQT